MQVKKASARSNLRTQFLPGWDARVAVLAVVVLVALLPVLLDSPFWMNVLVTAGAYSGATIAPHKAPMPSHNTKGQP